MCLDLAELLELEHWAQLVLRLSLKAVWWVLGRLVGLVLGWRRMAVSWVLEPLKRLVTALMSWETLSEPISPQSVPLSCWIPTGTKALLAMKRRATLLVLCD